MKLYLLRTKKLNDIQKGDALAYIVSGIDEKDARRFLYLNVKQGQIWTDDNVSSCVEIGLAKEIINKIYLANFQE